MDRPRRNTRLRTAGNTPFVLSALALTLGLAMSSLGCAKKADAQATPDPSRAAAEKRPPVAAKFQKVETRSLPQTIDVNGTLDADETSEVATQVSGVVTDVRVDVGTRVKKGDILAVLDPRDASLRAKQAVATQEQAQAKLAIAPGQKFDPAQVPDVRAAKETMDYAVADAQRTKQLFDSGTLSQAAWDQARTNAEQKKAQYDSALANAKQSWASLSAAQAASGIASKQVADSTIRAPFDGSVAEKRVSPGEYANIGRVIAVVVRDNPLRLKVEVAESDLAKVQIGRKVEVQVAAYPDRIFNGAVKRLGAALKQTSRTLPVEAEIPNDEGALRPGLFAKASIVVPGGDQKALLVPESAIGSTGSNSRIFVRQGAKVVEKLVKQGRRIGTMMEIVGGGVTDADEVATTNVDKLVDGAELAPGS